MSLCCWLDKLCDYATIQCKINSSLIILFLKLVPHSGPEVNVHLTAPGQKLQDHLRFLPCLARSRVDCIF